MALRNKGEDTLKDKYLSSLPFFKEEKAQKITGIMLTLFALSFFGTFALNPTFSTIAKLRKEIKDNEFVNNQLNQKIGDINRLKVQYATLQEDLPIVFESLPKKADVPLLTAQVQSIALDSNIHIKKIQNFEVELFNDKKIDKKYYSFTFSIAGNGTYEDINRFISDLSSMKRIVSVDVLSVERSATQGNSSLDLDVNAIAFFKE
ncbi:MAG: type 4a pilus biogenesis protein PilO [Candidatus Levybacteria bacterium]|nr:type 4a pilus biogenesis protein PilO [Candidatus Levybacteria bacterium]